MSALLCVLLAAVMLWPDAPSPPAPEAPDPAAFHPALLPDPPPVLPDLGPPREATRHPSPDDDSAPLAPPADPRFEAAYVPHVAPPKPTPLTRIEQAFPEARGQEEEAMDSDAPDMASAAPTFSQEALERQNTPLGPRRWMAELPPDEAERIAQEIDTGSALAAQALDTAEQERLLRESAQEVVTLTARDCANRSLSPRARIVVTIDRLTASQSHGRLFGVRATANVHAGSAPMVACLTRRLEGRHFATLAQEGTLSSVSIAVPTY